MSLYRIRANKRRTIGLAQDGVTTLIGADCSSKGTAFPLDYADTMAGCQSVRTMQAAQALHKFATRHIRGQNQYSQTGETTPT